MDIKEIFGKNIKKARESRGYTQEKFAELIGIGTPALSKIECGKSYPTLKTIEKIISILDIQPALLYVANSDIDIDVAYKEILERIEILKNNKTLFKMAYDYICELTK